jgi:hypothetical protein
MLANEVVLAPPFLLIALATGPSDHRHEAAEQFRSATLSGAHH